MKILFAILIIFPSIILASENQFNGAWEGAATNFINGIVHCTNIPKESPMRVSKNPTLVNISVNSDHILFSFLEGCGKGRDLILIKSGLNILNNNLVVGKIEEDGIFVIIGPEDFSGREFAIRAQLINDRLALVVESTYPFPASSNFKLKGFFRKVN